MKLERLRRLEARAKLLSFREFIALVRPGYVFYPHCDLLCDVLDRVARGEIRRLMVFMPPRHSKSETVSRLFSAYFLYRNPNKWVGINSYAADLAYTLSRAARENYAAAGGAVKSDASAVRHWETGQGGGMWAAGVGGAITGKGFHLGLIDDPLKNAEEAASEVIREKHKEWFPSTFYTREEPGGAIVVVQTRWNEDDLSGWLLSEEIQGEHPERWHIVNLPALSEETHPGEPRFPDTCTVEPDWREVGQALCPERYDEMKLAALRARLGQYFFDSLYQQRPSAREGLFFKVDQLQIADAAPAHLRLCRAWDLAATQGGGDFTAGVLIGIDSGGIWYVLDVARGQWGPDEVERMVKQTAALDPIGTVIKLPQDPGQAGKQQASQLIRMLAGYGVKADPVSGDKETRAFPFAAQMNAGNVRLVRGGWNRAFIEEYRSFPNGKFDDQVDGGSDAFNDLANGGIMRVTSRGRNY